MSLEQSPHSAAYSFSGHESFPLRYPWLPKTIQALQVYEDLFGRPDDLVILGVGKNMVRSMRHWCLTLDLLEPPRRTASERPSSLGKHLFSKDGWDPYLEDPGTLWLLHWKMVRRPERASAWYLIFSQFSPESTSGFTREEIIEWLAQRAEERPGTRATVNSIKRDVDVFIRTYVPSKTKPNMPPEDSFDSPLSELGLIVEIKRDTYAFDHRDKPALPDSIFLYSLIEFWEQVAPDDATLSFERIAYGGGSPGAAFKLPENELAERIERVSHLAGFSFDETAGMRQLLRREQPPSALEVLAEYYGSEVAIE
jgi:hypothetical protein